MLGRKFDPANILHIRQADADLTRSHRGFPVARDNTTYGGASQRQVFNRDLGTKSGLVCHRKQDSASGDYNRPGVLFENAALCIFSLDLNRDKYGKPRASIGTLRLPVGFAPFCRRPQYTLIGRATGSLSGSLLLGSAELFEYPTHLPVHDPRFELMT